MDSGRVTFQEPHFMLQSVVQQSEAAHELSGFANI
jgi:hypothetical protein